MKKYVVHPGYMKSKFDGGKHFITAAQLINLYGVNPEDVIIYSKEKEMGLSQRDRGRLIHLFPRYNGNYIGPKGE